MIGVFDSGIGGLTVVAALRDTLVGHDLLYLGDTARVPYGTRSPRTVRRYSLRVASWLAAQGADALVVACNTATTHALPALVRAGEQAGIAVFGVVQPGVTAALAAHRTGALAVLGTEGTISGAAYQTQIAAVSPGTEVHAVACPLFVPLVEEGWTEGEVPLHVAEHYLGHLRGSVDTAILGCTHYPLLTPVIAQVLPGVTLVDSAHATAQSVHAALGEGSESGTLSFAATDHLTRFRRVGERFLGADPAPVQAVDLPEASGPFHDSE